MASVAKAKEEEQKHVAQVEANVLKTILPALRDLGSETAVQGFIEHLHEDLLAVEARMYPSQFHFTADCRELARRAAVDIERVWEEVFGSGGAHLAKPQHVELLARLLFAYISIAGAEGDPNTRVVAAIRRAPRDGECDGGLLVNDHLPLTVECKCVFVGESVCDDVPANSFVVRNAGAAIAATHSLFVVVWRDTVEVRRCVCLSGASFSYNPSPRPSSRRPHRAWRPSVVSFSLTSTSCRARSRTSQH